MKRLILLRHAKSDWSDQSIPDRDRPLAARGVRSATAMRDHLEASDLRPNLVLCSSARRTRETLALVLPALGHELTVRIEPGLYTFSARDVLARIRDIDDGVPSALVIGHNPATEDLARMLSSDGGERIGSKYPTAALAVLDLDVDTWGEVGRSDGSLVAFVTPKELGSG